DLLGLAELAEEIVPAAGHAVKEGLVARPGGEDQRPGPEGQSPASGHDDLDLVHAAGLPVDLKVLEVADPADAALHSGAEGLDEEVTIEADFRALQDGAGGPSLQDGRQGDFFKVKPEARVAPVSFLLVGVGRVLEAEVRGHDSAFRLVQPDP